MQLDEIREKALANFELLLDTLKIEYKKITESEYDILATWRTDKNFGSVRFNTEKGRGADFAGGSFTDNDYRSLGAGFDKDDFVGFTGEAQAKIGFDIIGLFQRILRSDKYSHSARAVHDLLNKISSDPSYTKTARDAILIRKRLLEEKTKKLKKVANDLWESSKHHAFEHSAAELYIKNRGIIGVKDKNIRYHPRIKYGPTGVIYPAILFKVQIDPMGPLVAIHRIYLDPSGKKAKLDNPKMALAPIKGAGIWLGEPSKVLALTEGPENALTLLSLGYKFVVSSIYGTNLHNIIIPKYVKQLTIFPDVDNAGLQALDRAKETYGKLDIEVDAYLLPTFEVNSKKGDINDLVRG